MKTPTPTPPPARPAKIARAKPAARAATAAPSPADAHEAFVRATAYRLYEQRGRLDGFELDDWLQAEALCARTDPSH